MSGEDIKNEKLSRKKSDDKKKKKRKASSEKEKEKEKVANNISPGIIKKKKKKKKKKKTNTKETVKRMSKAIRAGLMFPPSRFQKNLRRGCYARRIGVGAGLYMAAVVEYLCAEILELSGNAAQDNKKARITPRHVMLAVRNDEELTKLLRDVYISEGGVLPSVHRILIHTIEQRRKLQKTGELPDDTVLSTQVTDSTDIANLSQHTRTRDDSRESSPKKKSKKIKKSKSVSPKKSRSRSTSRSRSVSRSPSRSRSKEDEGKTDKKLKKTKKSKSEKEEKEKKVEKENEDRESPATPAEEDTKKRTNAETDSEPPKKRRLSSP